MAESFQYLLKYKNKYILNIYTYLPEEFISTYVTTPKKYSLRQELYQFLT